MLNYLLIPLGALLWDLTLGDPPNRLHPVCLTGTAVSRLWKQRPPRNLFLYGVFLTLAVTLPAVLLGALIMGLPFPLVLIVAIPLFKATFSLKGLFKAGREIEKALAKADLEEARRLTGWHLVSRDTSELTRGEITGCVIESMAENLTDSLTSPFFWYGLGGLGGAWFCRSVNTCDAMIGYRRGDYEQGGKFAARLDDGVHWLPARFTALCLCLAAGLTRGLSGRRAWEIMLRDRRNTASPNAGWTMAAAAGALGIGLTKRDTYELNRAAREPDPEDLALLFKLIGRSAALVFITFFILYGGILWLI